MGHKYKIKQRKNGRYYAVVSLSDECGERHTKMFTSDSKAALRNEVDLYCATQRTLCDSTTFSGAMERYIKFRSSVLSPASIRTYRNYENQIKKDFPGFCAKRCDRIRQSDVQEVVNAIAMKHEPKGVRSYSGFISAVLHSRGIRLDPVTLPKPLRHDRKIPDEKTARAIIEASIGTRFENVIALAVYGLRRAEICALNPSEDLDGTTLHVGHALVYDEEHKLVRKAPKTEESDRYIEIDPELAERLRGLARVTDMSPDRLSHAYAKFLERNGFPHFRFHDWRHFYASYCHSIGIPDADIIAGGGWKTDNVMKNVYRHEMAKNRASAAIIKFREQNA